MWGPQAQDIKFLDPCSWVLKAWPYTQQPQGLELRCQDTELWPHLQRQSALASLAQRGRCWKQLCLWWAAPQHALSSPHRSVPWYHLPATGDLQSARWSGRVCAQL